MQISCLQEAHSEAITKFQVVSWWVEGPWVPLCRLLFVSGSCAALRYPPGVLGPLWCGGRKYCTPHLCSCCMFVWTLTQSLKKLWWKIHFIEMEKLFIFSYMMKDECIICSLDTTQKESQERKNGFAFGVWHQSSRSLLCSLVHSFMIQSQSVPVKWFTPETPTALGV